MRPNISSSQCLIFKILQLWKMSNNVIDCNFLIKLLYRTEIEFAFELKMLEQCVNWARNIAFDMFLSKQNDVHLQLPYIQSVEINQISSEAIYFIFCITSSQIVCILSYNWIYRRSLSLNKIYIYREYTFFLSRIVKVVSIES